MSDTNVPILPAARAVFNKNTVSVKEIAKEWGDTTVVVARNQSGKLVFIAGASGNYFKIGSRIHFVHDQTRASMGTWEIVNQLHLKDTDGTFVFDVPLEAGKTYAAKAGLYVFK